MTLKNRASLLCHFALFHSHRSILTGATGWKRQIPVKISNFLSRATLKFDGWPRKTIGHLFYATSNFVYHFIATSPETPNLGENWRFFVQYDLEIWRMTLKNNRVHLLCYFKLCVSIRSHLWIQTGVMVQKHPIRVKIGDFLSSVTLKNNRAPLLFHIKLCTSLLCHMWIQTGVSARKQLRWVVTSMSLTSDLNLLYGHHFCQC